MRIKKFNKKRFNKNLKRRKTTYKRRRTTTKTLTNYPLPRSRICKLKYCEQFTINPSMGVVGTYIFSANGCFDPNVTGSGHQPYGFDQMMAMYNHYQVLGSKITVHGTNTQEPNGFWVGIKLDDSGTLISADPVNILEQPYLRRKILSNSNQSVKINSFFSAKKFFSDKNLKAQYNDNLSGDAASNPVDQAYFIVMTAPYSSLQDVAALPMYAEIEYIVKFFEPKELPFS